MKKGAVGFGILILFVLMFFSSGVFAAPPAPGTCTITQASLNDCNAVEGNYKVMGLSAATNAHAEVPYNGYPYILCCGFGEGVTTCSGSPPINKILGLSSSTNAHAEVPEQTTYLNSVCYEDLVCKYSSTSNCGSGDVASYKLKFASLSSTTNAHVGGIDDFPIKICCKSARFLSYCAIQATGTGWRDTEVYEGVSAYLDIKGSGPECDGQSLKIEVVGATDGNATSVTFRGDTALSWWTAEWQGGGLFGADKSYSFNATVLGVLNYAGKSMVSDNQMIVRQLSIVDHCSTISSCEEYTDPTECGTDSPCSIANAEGVSQGVACDGVKTFCDCSWDSVGGTCGFVWSQIEPGSCEAGYTLCHDSVSDADYCYPAASCPAGNEPISNNNGICDTGEGCSSSDCSAGGGQDSCVTGSTCSGGMCSGTPPVSSSINCSYGYTLCQIAGINYCYPGSVCPSGQVPVSDSDGKCELGEGCLSADCKDGDQDSCVSGTYCMLGKCASIEDPLDLGLPTSTGGCKMTQTVEKNCDVPPEGYKIISWTGEWTGSGGNPSNPAYQKCVEGGRTSVPCPAQIQLSFFNIYNFLIALAVIAVVYVFLVSRKKGKRRKK